MIESVTLKMYPKLPIEMMDKANLALGKAATEAETEMKKRITSGQKSGNVYSRGNVNHTASAPGQSPANDTGKLAGSIKYKKIADNEHEVKISAEYALVLEVGGSKLLPRPFIMPTVLNARRKLEAAFRKLRGL